MKKTKKKITKENVYYKVVSIELEGAWQLVIPLSMLLVDIYNVAEAHWRLISRILISLYIRKSFVYGENLSWIFNLRESPGYSCYAFIYNMSNSTNVFNNMSKMKIIIPVFIIKLRKRRINKQLCELCCTR